MDNPEPRPRGQEAAAVAVDELEDEPAFGEPLSPDELDEPAELDASDELGEEVLLEDDLAEPDLLVSDRESLR